MANFQVKCISMILMLQLRIFTALALLFASSVACAGYPENPLKINIGFPDGCHLTNLHACSPTGCKPL